MTMRFHKIIKIALCIFVLLLVFCLGSLHGWVSREILTQKSGIYVYDMERKLDAFSKKIEKSFENLPPDEKGYAIDLYSRRLRPLVHTGRIALFIDTINGDYLVSEVREGRFDLGLLAISFLDPQESRTRSRLTFSSKIEEGWGVARFGSVLYYSEDNVYEKGSFSIHAKDGNSARTYLDTKGTGIFDEMRVQRNGIESLYRLDGLSWEKVAERD